MADAGGGGDVQLSEPCIPPGLFRDPGKRVEHRENL